MRAYLIPKIVFLCGLLYFFAPSLNAESFRHLDAANGLSGGSVIGMEQDSAGFIWLFTSKGIDRYDGTQVRHYPLEAGVLSNQIVPFTRMSGDRDRQVWVSLRSGKMFRYDEDRDRFVLEVDLPDRLLNDFVFDEGNRLWLCLSDGLYRWDREAGRLSPVYAFPGEIVRRIIQVDAHTFFVSASDQLYKIRLGDDLETVASREKIPLPEELRIESLYIYNNRLYIGTFAKGAFWLDLGSGKLSRLADIPAIPVLAITAVPGKGLFVGTDRTGLYLLDIESHALIKHYQTGENRVSSGLSGNTVNSLLVDSRGCLWIGTSMQGVNILDPLYPDVYREPLRRLRGNTSESYHINAILEDSDGDVWYGSNDGVSLYLSKSKEWVYFLRNTEGEDKRPPIVLALCEDAQKQVWVGGYGMGIYRIDKPSRQVRSFPLRDGVAANGVATDYIYSIAASGDEVWLGGIEGELTCYNLHTRSYTYYPANCVGNILIGFDGKLLLGTCAGLSILDRESGRLSAYTQGLERGIAQAPVSMLSQTAPGMVYLATDGYGLMRVNWNTGKSDSILPDDMNVSSINNVVNDIRGRIWFSSERQLFCYDPVEGSVTGMNDLLGIKDENFSARTLIRKRDGNLALGTSDGAITFSPDFIVEHPDTVEIIFTDFLLSNKPVRPEERHAPLTKAINRTKNISLAYERNSFSLTFSALNFLGTERIRYEACLSGFDKDWYEVDDWNVRYTNLPPGDYTLNLRAVSDPAKKVLGERALDVKISWPFWLSGWAFSLYILVLALVVYLTIRYLRHRIEERNMREKMDFFIQVAHDIRTPVTLIKAPLSELDERENLSAQGKKNLSLALRNTEKLFSMVTRLLDFQEADLSDLQISASTFELYAYMQEQVMAFSGVAEQKGIHLTLKADFDFLEVSSDRGRVDKIVSNLLSNALKYTPEGTITVSLGHTDVDWTIEVRDTGIGIPAHAQKYIFRHFYRATNAVNSQESGSGIGLLLTKKLTEQLQGTISFTSVENEGTTFRLTFPLSGRTRKEEVTEVEPVSEYDEATSLPSRQESIFVIEDNEDIRYYLRECLSTDYHVFTARNADEAMEQVREKNPDIIISDVLMPGMRGDEMCRLLKSSLDTSHISIILLTALNERENIINGLDSGADDYITKPFDMSVLKARIRNILQSRKKMRSMLVSEELIPEEMNYASPLDKEFLDKVGAMIEQELGNADFSVVDFCKALGMSRTAVYNKMKTLTDLAPNDYIRRVRLNKSKALLASRRYSVQEVALMVGFSDAKYFSTCFKKQFGMSPSKVR